VLCIGYELPKIVPTSGHSIASTWVIATRPQPKHLIGRASASSGKLRIHTSMYARPLTGELSVVAKMKSSPTRLGATPSLIKRLKSSRRSLPGYCRWSIHAQTLPGRLRSVRARLACRVSVHFLVIRAVTVCWVTAATASHTRCWLHNSFLPR
jgi:hypothetical protein